MNRINGVVEILVHLEAEVNHAPYAVLDIDVGFPYIDIRTRQTVLRIFLFKEVIARRGIFQNLGFGNSLRGQREHESRQQADY